MKKTFSNVENTDFSRHWCPESEKITGGDALISMIRAGWRLDAKILRENCFLSGIRQTTIYHIRLNRDGQTRQMHVLCNPYITRLLSLPGISIEDVAATHYPCRSVSQCIARPIPFFPCPHNPTSTPPSRTG